MQHVCGLALDLHGCYRISDRFLACLSNVNALRLLWLSSDERISQLYRTPAGLMRGSDASVTGAGTRSLAGGLPLLQIVSTPVSVRRWP